MAYTILTDDEIKAALRRLNAERLKERDIRHLITLLDKECYDEWAYNVENRGPFWMALRFAYEIDGTDKGFTLYADSDYFERRKILRVDWTDDDVDITFESWMDFGVLEMMHERLTHWVDEVETRINTVIE